MENNSYQVPKRSDPIKTDNPEKLTPEFVRETSTEKLAKIYHGLGISKGIWLAFGIHSSIFCGVLGMTALGVGRNPLRFFRNETKTIKQVFLWSLMFSSIMVSYYLGGTYLIFKSSNVKSSY